MNGNGYDYAPDAPVAADDDQLDEYQAVLLKRALAAHPSGAQGSAKAPKVDPRSGHAATPAPAQIPPQPPPQAFVTPQPMAGGPPPGAHPPQSAQTPPSPPVDPRTRSRLALERATELATTMPDMTQLAAAHRAEQERHREDQIAAINLQLTGGETFSDYSQALLRRALAAQGTKEVPGGWGTITPGGTFIPNPMKARESEISRLETQARIWEQQAQHAETVEERREGRAAADATRRDIARMHDETRRMVAGAAAGRAAETRETRAQAAQERRDQQIFQREHTLRGDYTKATKDINDTLRATTVLQELTSTPYAKQTAQTQMATIFSFMRMLDPTSVVREAEYKSAANARGLLDQVNAYAEQLRSGKMLTPTQVANMGKVANQLQGAMQELRGDYNRQFSETAQRWGVDPRGFIRGDTGAGAAPGGGGSGWGIVR